MSSARIVPNANPHICIVGGGFGGLYTALYLQKYRHLQGARITLIEPKERFLFTPMMYELITGELKEWEIAPTYGSLITGTNITWLQSHADAVDLAQRTVTVSGGQPVAYDYLVMAMGADSRRVSIPGVDEHALTFRTFEDSQQLKARLAQLVRGQQLQLQTIPSTSDTDCANGTKTDEAIRVTVIGGGASGVELACKVADYFSAQGCSRQITLVERGPMLLKPFSKGLKRQAKRALAKRQVSVVTETGVAEVSAEAVTLEVGDAVQVLPSHLTLWAVGTQPRAWIGEQPVEHNDYGQRLTRRSLQLLNYDHVFVLGDSAEVRGPQQQLAPNTAQSAFQAASRVAANLALLSQGEAPKPFNYLHLGDMITLGVGDAGLSSFGITLGGWLAALCRRGVYVFRMPTQRHQLKVGRRALGELAQAIFLPWKKRRSVSTLQR